MADLTPLDEKLAEVLGLAQAAQAATTHVAKMDGAEEFQADLDRSAATFREAMRDLVDAGLVAVLRTA